MAKECCGLWDDTQRGLSTFATQAKKLTKAIKNWIVEKREERKEDIEKNRREARRYHLRKKKRYKQDE